MPFKVWQPLEPVDADEFQLFLQDQVAARFTSYGQRSTLLPDPFVGQLSAIEEGSELDMFAEDGRWMPAAGRLVGYAQHPLYTIPAVAQWYHINFTGPEADVAVRNGWTWSNGAITIRDAGYYSFNLSISATVLPSDIWLRCVINPEDSEVKNPIVQNRMPNLVPEGGGPGSGKAAGAVTSVQHCAAGSRWGIQIRAENKTEPGQQQANNVRFSCMQLVTAPAPTGGTIRYFG